MLTPDGLRLRLVRLVLIAAALLIIVVTVTRSVSIWHRDSNLNHVAGAMVTLALDLKEGVFYRPVSGEEGYGGTRYFPLFLSIHAGLIALAGNPVITGYALSVAATVLLIIGVYSLLRSLEIDRTLAFILATSVLAAWSAQHALTTIQGDILPAALNVWGIVLCVRAGNRTGGIAAGALLFSLAFAAKVTTLFGAAAAFFHFLFNGRRKTAFHLLILTAAGCFLVLGVMHILSAGRVFPILKVTASGGATLRHFAKSPLNMIYQVLVADPAGLPFLAVGFAAFLAGRKKDLKGIAQFVYLFTLLATLVIFGSPGTSINHLLDLHVASLVVFAVWVRGENGTGALFALVSLTVGLLVALRVLTLGFPGYEELKPRGEEYRRIAHSIGRSDRPVFSEDPFVPIFCGQRPYLGDAFALRIIRAHDPSVTGRLWNDLSGRRFSAVVLYHDPDTAFGKNFLTHIHFGDGFLEKRLENYELRDKIGDHRIYVPRQKIPVGVPLDRTSEGGPWKSNGSAPVLRHA